jgi:hypothetical protein
MNAKCIPCIWVSLCSLLFGCGGSDDGSDNIESLCSSACAKGASLNCPGDTGSTAADCEAECKDIRQNNPKCNEQFEAYLSCVDAVAVEKWVCDKFEESSIPSGSCDAEFDAMDVCVISN